MTMLLVAAIDKSCLRRHPSTMLKVRRVTWIAVAIVTFGLGSVVLWLIPNESHFEIGSLDFEMSKRPAPGWLLLVGLCEAVLILVCWWKYRKAN